MSQFSKKGEKIRTEDNERLLARIGLNLLSREPCLIDAVCEVRSSQKRTDVGCPPEICEEAELALRGLLCRGGKDGRSAGIGAAERGLDGTTLNGRSEGLAGEDEFRCAETGGEGTQAHRSGHDL